MAKRSRSLSVFEQIKSGLEDCLAHARGELTLATVRLPAPPPKTDAKRIVALRRNLRMSQAVFAATLNVSKRTVQSWEQGLRQPSEASLRLLQILRVQPAVVNVFFGESFPPVRGIRSAS
ncbi:MAG: helix-turn-helix domain-containing protein [Candidatus Hydrogenedentes bacterium]|nr:helix-turn-helix domain-containing protein [Candidatus Hydrogenedentota bacterium]